MSQVISRLEGIKYIFLDEVSMLSAHDMYKISYQLSCILNIYDKPFGGVNMVFADDFAQLPPAMDGENISLYGQFIGARCYELFFFFDTCLPSLFLLFFIYN